MARSNKYRLELHGRQFMVTKKANWLSRYMPIEIVRHTRSCSHTDYLAVDSEYDGRQVIAKLIAGYAVFAIYSNIYFVNDKGEPERITGKCPNAI